MIRISVRTLAKLVGGALLVVGIILLSQSATVDVQRTVYVEKVDCGRAMNPVTLDDPIQAEECADKLDGPRTAGFIVGGLGVVDLLIAFFVAFPSRRVGESAVSRGELG